MFLAFQMEIRLREKFMQEKESETFLFLGKQTDFDAKTAKSNQENIRLGQFDHTLIA